MDSLTLPDPRKQELQSFWSVATLSTRDGNSMTLALWNCLQQSLSALLRFICEVSQHLDISYSPASFATSLKRSPRPPLNRNYKYQIVHFPTWRRSQSIWAQSPRGLNRQNSVFVIIFNFQPPPNLVGMVLLCKPPQATEKVCSIIPYLFQNYN